jgi:hypothetical protein
MRIIQVLILTVILNFHNSAKAAKLSGDPDVSAICKRALSEDLSGVNRVLWKMDENTLTKGESSSIVAGVFASIYADTAYIDWSPWLLQDVTRRAYPEAALSVQTSFAERLLGQLKISESPETIVNEAAKSPTHYSETAITQGKTVVARYKAFGPHAGLAEVKHNSILLCAPYLDLNCSKALVEVVDLMSSRIVPARKDGVLYAANFQLLQRIFSDPSLVQGAAKATQMVLAKVRRHESANSNLLADLVRAYSEAGASTAEANDRAWTILGFYGLRGASMAPFENVINSENAKLWVSLYLLSASLGILDHETYESGKPYSYPVEVTARCAFSRPYYFWMAADLGRHLRSKGFSVKTSVTVTHLINKLYQFGVSHGLRDPNRIYRDKFQSGSQVGVQTALAYGLAGAMWGAGVRDAAALNVDTGMSLMLKGARPLPDMTPDELKEGLKSDTRRYLWFHQLINPDAYLKSIRAVTRSN